MVKTLHLFALTILVFLGLDFFPATIEQTHARHGPPQPPEEEDLRVFIVPGQMGLPEVGETLPVDIGPLRAIAAGHFDIAIVVTDEDRRRVNRRGGFRFSWSLNSYVNPINPPAKPAPVNILQANHQSIRAWR